MIEPGISWADLNRRPSTDRTRHRLPSALGIIGVVAGFCALPFLVSQFADSVQTSPKGPAGYTDKSKVADVMYALKHLNVGSAVVYLQDCLLKIQQPKSGVDAHIPLNIRREPALAVDNVVGQVPEDQTTNIYNPLVYNGFVVFPYRPNGIHIKQIFDPVSTEIGFIAWPRSETANYVKETYTGSDIHVDVHQCDLTHQTGTINHTDVAGGLGVARPDGGIRQIHSVSTTSR